jgi:two-component system chemotaxis response regulator CheY
VKRVQATSVLLVDDSHTTTTLIRACLEYIGIHNVDTVDNGEAALKLLRTKSYGLVLSDWHMWPMTGPELLEHVQRELRAPRPRFVFMTMDNRWSSMTTARAMGAEGFIVKPDNPRALRSKIEALFPAVEVRPHEPAGSGMASQRA